jgi:hypothetical protein
MLAFEALNTIFWTTSSRLSRSSWTRMVPSGAAGSTNITSKWQPATDLPAGMSSTSATGRREVERGAEVDPASPAADGHRDPCRVDALFQHPRRGDRHPAGVEQRRARTSPAMSVPRPTEPFSSAARSGKTAFEK